MVSFYTDSELFLVGPGTITPTGSCGGPPNQVTICHSPGNSNNPTTIMVSANAVAAHLAHGDTLGPCPV